MERGKQIEGESEKGELANNFEGYQVSYDQADSILVEPWGGNTGEPKWNYKFKSPIKEILVAHGDIIDSIMFRIVIEQGNTIDSIKFGGDGGRRDKVVIEATPLEYLTGIKGTFGRYYGHSVIKSLCFITNAKNYGPFGCEEGGTPFSLVMKEGVAIIGFHGRSRKYLNAIGVYLQKLAPPTSAKEPMVENIDIRAILGLLENIELLKRELKDVYLKAPYSSQLFFPLSDAPLFMHLLLTHLNDLLNSNAYLVALIKEEIRLVKDDLEFIRSFFGIVEQELYKNLWARVLDVAYETKDVINSIIVRDNGLLHLIFSLPLAIEKINLIKERVSNLFEKIPKNMGVIVVNSPNKPVERKSSIAGKIIVGFKEETYLIIRKLTSGPKTLDVISITGMPGSGKTTLAYKVYNDKSIFGHFDIRAWCTVDQKYEEMELLKKLFNQVVGSASKFGKNIDVVDKLRKHLFGKRYLIVLDDLWDTAAWEELTRPFPEVENGSRIILTTREKKVAMHAQRHSDPLDLRLLRLEESWELLEKKVFGKESCPDELLDVGKEIVQNCKRLPLVVDLIAGVIAGKDKKRSVWLEVRNDLNSFILLKEENVMNVIALSYDYLPDPLKLCLLYFASYQKDRAIQVEVLKRLWLSSFSRFCNWISFVSR